MPYIKGLEDGMRKYSSYLYELERENFRLFEFSYDMPTDYKPIFEERFWRHYRYFQIGAETPLMFRDWIADKLNIVLPKYLRLYESVDIFSNPFVNYVLEYEQKVKNAQRGKTYSTYDNRALAVSDGIGSNWGDSKGGSTIDDYTASQTSNRGVNKNKKMVEHSRVNELNEVKSNLFTDTPQNKNLKQEQAKGGKIINDNDEENAKHEIWNDGYSTTATRDYLNNGNVESFKYGDGGVNYGSEKSSGEATSKRVDSNSAISRNINSNISKSNSKLEGNNYGVNVNVNEKTLSNTKFGLKGITLSQAVLEWRKTFINVDKLLLKEFRECFLYIY